MILYGKSVTFRGFIMQGRSKDGAETIGYWKNVAATTQGLDCISGTIASQNSQLGQCEIDQPCGVSISSYKYLLLFESHKVVVGLD